jgi:uncharacterized RDD family membrane protein YckC
MKSNASGKLVLELVGTSAAQQKVVIYLASLFKKASREKVAALVNRAPVVLIRRIPAYQAWLIIDHLKVLGAVASFIPNTAASLDLPCQTLSDHKTAGARETIARTKAANLSICSQCQQMFSEQEMLRYADLWVCASCKPVFIQKLREGEQIFGRMVYAGFWTRVAAKVIDGIIVLFINFSLSMILLMIFRGVARNETSFLINLLMNFGNLIYVVIAVVYFVIAVGYATLFLGRCSATPGKMACKVKVLVSDASRISYVRSLGRYFAEWASCAILGIGYLMAAFDNQKRTLHDRICATRVVKK